MNAYRRCIMEVCLEAVRLRSAGGRGAGHRKHMVMGRLIWPRPAIAEKAAVKTLDIRGLAVDLRGASWTDRILFKETVQGPVGLELGITESLSDARLAGFVRFLGASLFRLAASEAGDMMVSPMSAALGKIPLQYAGKVLSAKPKPADLIGVGTVDLLPETFQTGEGSIVLDIPLVAPVPVTRLVRTRVGGEPRLKRRVVVAAGADNGVAVVRVRLYA